jgi:hypothetical protein
MSKPLMPLTLALALAAAMAPPAQASSHREAPMVRAAGQDSKPANATKPATPAATSAQGQAARPTPVKK